MDLAATLSSDEATHTERVASVVEASKPYLKMLDMMFETRRFFTTKKGRIGIRHQCLLPGDKIFVIKNASYLIILRAGDNGRYTTVGVGY